MVASDDFHGVGSPTVTDVGQAQRCSCTGAGRCVAPHDPHGIAPTAPRTQITDCSVTQCDELLVGYVFNPIYLVVIVMGGCVSTTGLQAF